jgi:hypothetical protein
MTPQSPIISRTDAQRINMAMILSRQILSAVTTSRKRPASAGVGPDKHNSRILCNILFMDENTFFPNKPAGN